MSGSTTSSAPGPTEPAPDGPADDPLAADKRTLIIALVAMVGLMSIGIVSAAVFTGSACEDIGPSPVTALAASSDADAVLTSGFPDATPEVIDSAEVQLVGLGAQLGTITGVAVVDAAERLTATSDGLAATGSISSLLTPSGSEVTAAVDVGSGVVVGDGDALVSLARVNDLTGQVDAFATLDATGAGGLGEIGCVDTATVGTPLAFELDAGEGQLLLFRADEDGDGAELELRDPREGRLWFSRVDVGAAPPGVTGERIDARLGDDRAVLVRRTAPGEDVPVVTMVDRVDGALVWTAGREALEAVPVPAASATAGADGAASGPVVSDGTAQRLDVLALDDEQVVVAITGARDEDAVVAGGTDALGPSVGPGHVVAFDASDGTPRWQRSLRAGVEVLAVDSDASGVWLVLDDGRQTQLVGFDAAGDGLGGSPDGVVIGIDAPSSSEASAAVVVTELPSSGDAGPDGRMIVAALRERLVVVRALGDDLTVEAIDLGGALTPRDVLAIGDRLHVLFAWQSSDDDRAVVVTLDTGG